MRVGRVGGELATDNPGYQLVVDLLSINLQCSVLGDFVGLHPSLRVFSSVGLRIPHPWHTPSYNIAPSPPIFKLYNETEPTIKG